MIILAIETSCDDTSVAIIEVKSKKQKAKNANPEIKVLANLISSQIRIHKKWGGVVPNLASRAHAKNLPIVFGKALKEAKLKIKDIDVIALTIGPGLSPSLLIGVHFARALGCKYNKPIIPVNHVEGHICSNFFQKFDNSEIRNPKSKTKSKIPNSEFRIQFPIMNLIVSGGHTSLYLMKGYGKYQLVGKTRDDAAGEAFDKAAKMMGLGYPGGPIISALAESYKLTAISYQLTLPRPMINSKDFDFSFSGLKTAVFYKLREISEKEEITKNIKMAIAYEFQQSVIDVLISKTISAAKKYKTKTIAISGGVSANSELRKQFEQKAKENGITFVMPPKDMSTDNGLMIAIAGYYNFLAGNISTWDKIDADPNLKL